MSEGATYDAVVIGSGPNGLAAAIEIARAQLSVLVLEARPTIGGGIRTEELTLPGFKHDVCSAVHPMGLLSPYFTKLPLAEHGLTWLRPEISVAHPFDDGSAAVLARSFERMAASIGEDAATWEKLVRPFLKQPDAMMADLLAPLRIPRHPLRMLRYGLVGLRSAVGLARRFRGPRARALFGGCAAHSILPLERLLTGAMGLIFVLTGHIDDWPVARGGSAAIADALASYLRSLGGEIATDREIRSYDELPRARVYLFDTSPRQLTEIAGGQLPNGYKRRLGRYRYGPGVFKVDWALDGPIPWTAADCHRASTVHIGGTLEELVASEAAPFRGEPPERPYLIVCQQSHLDPSRAPEGRHTGYAYCHVPAACDVDMTERIEAQIERFAPGFRDRILARHSIAPADLALRNANYIGGAITGGVADIGQLFFRPVARLNPYATPNPSIFLCSSSTPPGGGVHGMCGYWAARAALRRLGVRRVTPLL